MAKYGKSLAEVKVYINGREQAQKELEILRASAEKLGLQIDDANNKMLEASEQLAEARKRAERYSGSKDSAEYKSAVDDEIKAQTAFDNASKSANAYAAELKQTNKAIKETERLNVDLEEALNHLSEQDLVRLRKIKREVTAVRDRVKGSDDPDMEFLTSLNKALEDISDTIKRKMGGLAEFEDIIGKITHVDDRTLEGVIKRLKDLIATTDKLEVEKLRQYKDELAKAEGVQRSRIADEGQSVVRRVREGKYSNTVEGTQEDIKSLERYMKVLDTSDKDALKEVNSVIDRLKQNIKETESGFLSFEDAMKKAKGIMSGTFDPTLDDLEKIQKVLKEGMQDKFHIANPEDETQLKQTLGLMEEMLKKQKEVMRLNHQDKVDAVNGKLDKVSPAEIEEAVKAAKELQQVAKTKEEFIQLGEFIGKAETRLKDWNETSKQSVMKSQIKDLSAIRALSDGALQDQLKFWEGTMNAAKKTSTAYKEAKKNFEDLQGESKRRLQFEGEKTINDVKLGIGDGSTKQMQDRLKLLQDYRAVIDGTKPDAYKAVDEAILKLTEDIKAGQAGFMSFNEALKKAQGVMDGSFKPTLDDLEQIQKVLKEGMQSKFNLVDDADIDKLKETRSLMDEMAKKQAEADRIRLKDQADKILVGNYTKTIEGTKQAIELLKKYQETLDTTKPDAINEVTKSINKMKKELESAARAKAEEVMANPIMFSADEINEAIKLTEKLQSATNNATVWENYEQQLIKAREARDRFADDSKYKAMVKQFEDLEDLTANAWAEQKKYWEAMRDSGKYYDEAIEKLKEMQELETTRMKDSSTKTLTTDLLTAGTGDIKQSVEWLTKYQASLEPLGGEWTDINNLIKAGEERLKSITETVSKQNLSEQAGKIMGGDYTKTIEGTKQAIEILKKYQQTLDATNTKGINKVEESIKRMSDELDAVTKKNARETLTTNLKVAGTEDIKQAVDWLTKYQGTLKPLSPLWKKINKEIEAGNERMKELSDGKKMAAMTEQFKKYKDLSVNALAEQKKYWTEVKNTHAETDKEYKRAVARLEKIDELEKSRTKAEATPLITEATSGTWDKTIEETEKAIKLIQEYKKQLHTSTDAPAIADANKAIDALNANLGKSKEGLMDFGDAIAKAKTIAGGTFSGTLEDLEKLQKALKEGINTKLDITSDADIDRLKEAQKLLEDIANEQQKAARARLEEQAKDTQAQVKTGTYKGTIEETEKAIELQRQYMKLLDTTDAAGIKDVEDTIEALQQKLKQAKNELMSYKDAMAEVDKMNKGTWRGTIEDLEKIKKSLEYHKKNKLDVGGDTKGLKDIEKALREIEKTGRGAHMSMADIDKLIKDLDSASVEKLTIAAKELQDQLQDAVRGTQEYAETAAKLREVNLELKKAKKEWEGQENVIVRTAKRLMAYVAVYGGFNEILGKMKELVGLNLSLSDSMADVQKTTGLAGVELQELGKEIERIDSRTSTEKLYEIAAAAGQIGLKTQGDVLGFTKAANTITVALNELGTEGAANLMKIATLTGEVASYGTEDALMRVGSAINELTASSAATAGPITDFIGRVGGIASASKIAISEMAALGAVTDASAQSVEIAGTSMNKFISALMSNTENIAYAANISAKELQGLIDNGQTMEAVVRVLESMQTMSRGAQSALLKELGSEGARMNQYVAALVSNLDMLKEQLAISRKAFEENVSVINEYNVKQESAAGILERMKNSFADAFVNSSAAVGMVRVLKDISKVTSQIVDFLSDSIFTQIFVGILNGLIKVIAWLSQCKVAIIAVKTALTALFIYNIPKMLFTVADRISFVAMAIRRSLIPALSVLSKAWHNALIATGQYTMTARGAVVAVNGLSGAIRALWALLRMNPWGVIITAASVAIAVFSSLENEHSKLIKATSELSNRHLREREELEALRTAMESATTSYEVKAKALETLNSLYSKYLGFQISEIDSYEKKAAALDLINAKLREQQALEMKNRYTEYANERFDENTEDPIRNIERLITQDPKIGRERWVEAMSEINKAIESGVSDTEELLQRLADKFETDFTDLALDGVNVFDALFGENEFKDAGKSEYDVLSEALEKYAEEYSKRMGTISSADAAYNSEMVSLRAESYEKLSNLAEAHQNDIAALELAHRKKIQEAEKEGRKISEQEQIAHLQALKRENEQYLKTAKQMQEHWQEEDSKKLKDPMIANEDGSFIPSMVGTVFGRAASVEAKEYNDLLVKRNNLNKEYLGTTAKIKAAEKDLAKVEKQRKDSWKTPEEEDAYLKALGVAHENVEREKKERDRLYKELKATDLAVNEQFGELSSKAVSSARKEWTDAITEITAEIESLGIRIAGDPYGKGFNVKNWKDFGTVIENLDTSSIDALAAAYKKLRDESMTITADVEAFNKMFEPKTPKKNLDELNEQVLEWANQIRQELASRGRGVTGEFLFGEGKKGYDQVLEQLKTHFLKQQNQLRESYLKGLMTGPELKRRLEANNKEFANARIELNKLMLGQANHFDKTLYPELTEANLSKLARTIFSSGEEIRNQIEQNLEEDQNAILEKAIQTRESLEKEFNKTSPFRTLDDQFKDTLDNLGLMSSEFERQIVDSLSVGATEINKFGNMIKHWDPLEVMGLDAENMEKRFNIIKEYASRSYTVDAEGLRDMMREHQDYDNWIRPMKTEQLEYLLQASRWYYDQELLAVKNYTSQLKKEYDSMYNQLQLKMSDSGRAQWEIEQLQGKLMAPNLEEGQRKAIIARINELVKIRDDARKKESDKAKSHRNKQEREAKEQMEASISALQAYYNEMEALIRKQGLENKWTPEDIERKVLANKIAAERDEIELRKKLLGEVSAFDPNANNGYKGVITGHEFFGSNKGEKELKKQAEQIKVWGKALVDGMRNQIAKGEIEIATEAEKVREKVKKALLEGDMFGKFENDFSDMLDEIGVLTSEFEDKMNEWHTTVKNSGGPDFGISLSEDERKSRIAALTQFADEAYSLTAESLRERMAQNTIYANWVNNLNDDEMGILLQKLRGYYDDRLALTKKYQDQMKKGFDAYYQQTGKQAEYEQKKNDIELRNQQQSDLEGFGVTRGVDYGAKRQSISDSFDVENQKYLDQIAKYKEQSEALTKDMVDVMREKGLGSPEYQEMYRQKEAMDQLILDTELERNQLLAQSQRDLTQVYMDEWTKRAERWGQWGEMFGEYLGEQVMLEKQANDARARGDLETAKKIEQQQKQNKQALIQNLLSKIVDEAALWAKEYALKMMFNSLMLAEEKKKAIEEVTLQGKQSMLSIFLSALTGQAAEAKIGLPGLITGAIVFAATMALQAMAKSAISNMFPEAATESTGNRKLSTGMLTYAEGNYPVLGNDGKVYDAKYEGAGMKTGVYGGGAHFGIFSEKQPEMIVDGKTTQKIILNYPYIYDAITTIAKNGRLKNAMPTFATGDYPAGMKQLVPTATLDASAGNNEQMERMSAVMEQTQAVNRKLLILLQGGITAHLDGLETYKQQKKNERFMKRRGID